MKEKPKCVGYCRMAIESLENRCWLYASTLIKSDGTNSEQMQVLLKISKELGLTVVGISMDTSSDYSAGIKRPGLQQMLQAVREEKVGTVLVCSIFRLSRDMDVMTTLFKEFKQHHVRLLGREGNFTKNQFESEADIAILKALKSMEFDQPER